MPTTTIKKPTLKKSAARKTAVRKAARPRVTRQVSEPKTVDHERAPKLSYVFAVGRRKGAVARVRWHASQPANITVNGRPLTTYFPTFELQHIVLQPLVLTHHETHGAVTAKVNGGGINGQAESVRLGIARALVKVDADLRLVLKRAGFLRRDPRVKERKKYGLKRARRAPQWQKR